MRGSERMDKKSSLPSEFLIQNPGLPILSTEEV